MILDLELRKNNIASYVWGSDQRVPVAGEQLYFQGDAYTVELVIWELVDRQVKGYVPVQHVTLQITEVAE